MKNKIFITIVFIILLQLSGGIIFADNGWEGYGIHNINDSEVDIVKERADIVLRANKLYYKGELIIKSKSDKDQEVILGLPSDYIENLSASYKGNAIKTYKISQKNIIKINKSNSLPSKELWRVFNLKLKPGETVVISINYESKPQINEKGAIVLRYPAINNNSIDQLIKELSVRVRIDDFKIYNLISADGIDNQGLLGNGEFLWDSEKNNEEMVLKYQDVEQAAMNYLSGNNDNKYRKIVDSFNATDFDSVISLSQEAVKSETVMEKINILNYLISESYRNLSNDEQFIMASNNIDVSKLYPAELSWKVYYDRINYYNHVKNLEALKQEVSKAESNSLKNLSLLSWAHNIYKKNDVTNANNENTFNSIGQSNDENFLAITLKAFKNNIIVCIIIFAIGSLLGFTLGRASGRNRRNRYMFRR